jgi:GrpB-like predicted nucleotidyltransferase (UPF0157 family)
VITIAAYDPRWVDDFQRLAAALHEALGARALRIDHIGSTAAMDLIHLAADDWARRTGWAPQA